VAVPYFISGVGLDDGNLALLELVTQVLVALGKPFFIMADWNFEPAMLSGSDWLRSVGGSIVSSGRPTCTMMGSASEIDFGVASAQWIVKPSASLFEPWTPSPHTAVLMQMPWTQPVVVIEVCRKPKTFPVRPPFGPFHDEVISTAPQSDLLCAMPVAKDVLEAAASSMYGDMDKELATKYGVDLVDCKGKPTGFGGRDADMGTKFVPIFKALHGISGGNHVSAFLSTNGCAD